MIPSSSDTPAWQVSTWHSLPPQPRIRQSGSWRQYANGITDEPRRSGRATKGLHTKNDGSPESTNDAPKSKPTATKNKGSTKASAEPVQDEEEEDDSVIRCVCGNQTDKPLGRMMICCDMCESWQHNDCMGITENEDELPENYLCERCAPDQHKDLLAAMNRGEKPWERKKKPTKKGKAVRQSSTMETSEQGTPAADSSNKRKHGNDDAEQVCLYEFNENHILTFHSFNHPNSENLPKIPQQNENPMLGARQVERSPKLYQTLQTRRSQLEIYKKIENVLLRLSKIPSSSLSRIFQVKACIEFLMVILPILWVNKNLYY